MSDSGTSKAKDVSMTRRDPGIGIQARGTCDRCGKIAASRKKAGRYRYACGVCFELVTKR